MCIRDRYLILLKELLGTGEDILAYQGWHGDLDPLFAWALMTCCYAGRSHTPPTLRADDTCPRRGARLTETGDTRYAELRNTAQTVERSHRALALRVGMPSALIRRVISPMLRPSTVYIS